MTAKIIVKGRFMMRHQGRERRDNQNNNIINFSLEFNLIELVKLLLASKYGFCDAHKQKWWGREEDRNKSKLF